MVCRGGLGTVDCSYCICVYDLQRGPGPVPQHLLLCHLYEDEPYLPHFQPQRAQQATVDLTHLTALHLLRYPLQQTIDDKVTVLHAV
jgi:hypothetical protein